MPAPSDSKDCGINGARNQRTVRGLAYALAATVLLLALACPGLFAAAAAFGPPVAQMWLTALPLLAGAMFVAGLLLGGTLLWIRSSGRDGERLSLTTIAAVGIIAGTVLFSFG